MYFDPVYMLIIVVSTVLGLVTQGYVNHTYRRWSQVPAGMGATGAEIARRILDSEGLYDVTIERVPGHLTDHYDPRRRYLGLSQDVYSGATVAAVGVAAHEAGHALQDAKGYVWGRVRTALVPVAQFGSNMSFILIIIGVAIGLAQLAWLGIALFAGAVLFQVVTLPVEFDASRRALAALSMTGGLSPDQVAGARHVLTAAALTYVAAALVAVLQLLYWLGFARGRD